MAEGVNRLAGDSRVLCIECGEDMVFHYLMLLFCLDVSSCLLLLRISDEACAAAVLHACTITRANTRSTGASTREQCNQQSRAITSAYKLKVSMSMLLLLLLLPLLPSLPLLLLLLLPLLPLLPQPLLHRRTLYLPKKSKEPLPLHYSSSTNLNYSLPPKEGQGASSTPVTTGAHPTSMHFSFPRHPCVTPHIHHPVLASSSTITTATTPMSSHARWMSSRSRIYTYEKYRYRW